MQMSACSHEKYNCTQYTRRSPSKNTRNTYKHKQQLPKWSYNARSCTIASSPRHNYHDRRGPRKKTVSPLTMTLSTPEPLLRRSIPHLSSRQVDLVVYQSSFREYRSRYTQAFTVQGNMASKDKGNTTCGHVTRSRNSN